jgi:hypothetical protein
MATTVVGTTGNDTLFGNTAQASLLDGKEGNDRLVSDFTNSTLNGAAGNDLFQIGSYDGATNHMNPGKGNDTIGISGLNAVGTLHVAASNSTNEFNLGNDIFNFNASRGSTQLIGTINGGAGLDTMLVGAGVDFSNSQVNLNQNADNLAISAVTTENFINSKIGLGADNDSATISSTNGQTISLNAFTLAGGKGKDTLQMGLDDMANSGNTLFAMGGGADVISAQFNGTGLNSGSITLRGDSGADTITVLNSKEEASSKFSIFGDESIAATGAFNDLITFDLAMTALALTGTIAGGGGADTINITSTQTAGAAGQSIDGGFGADVIKLAGIAFAGTMNGGGGNDSMSIEFNSTGLTAQDGTNFMTLVGGAGNDTFVNTALITSSTIAGAAAEKYYSTALVATLGDFTTGDVFQILGMKIANADANVARSAFFTSSFTGFTAAAGQGITGLANNNISLFSEGDDVILQILNGTGSVSNDASASAVGMSVIRFKANSAFGSNIAAASGQLSAISFAYTQTLNGATFNFT